MRNRPTRSQSVGIRIDVWPDFGVFVPQLASIVALLSRLF
jgi:hypothetical protein